jgi:hypothetical protein
VGLRHRVREGRRNGLHPNPHRRRLLDLRLVEARWVPRLRLDRVPRAAALLAGVPHRRPDGRRAPLHAARALTALPALLAVEHRQRGVGDARARDLRGRHRFPPSRARPRRGLARRRAARTRDGAAACRAGGLRRARLRRPHPQGAAAHLPRPAHAHLRPRLPAGRRGGAGRQDGLVPRRPEPHPGIGRDRAVGDRDPDRGGGLAVHTGTSEHTAASPTCVRHRLLPAVPVRSGQPPGAALVGRGAVARGSVHRFAETIALDPRDDPNDALPRVQRRLRARLRLCVLELQQLRDPGPPARPGAPVAPRAACASRLPAEGAEAQGCSAHGAVAAVAGPSAGAGGVCAGHVDEPVGGDLSELDRGPTTRPPDA